jgi:hypothetical protein
MGKLGFVTVYWCDRRSSVVATVNGRIYGVINVFWERFDGILAARSLRNWRLKSF